MPIAIATKTITAENSFSDWVEFRGPFNFSLSGTFSATVHLQRSFDGGVTAKDVASYTAATELVGDSPEPGVKWRFGVKTGGFTSGSAVGRLSQ